MKILYSIRHTGITRLYDTALRLLAQAGHSIDIVSERTDRLPTGEAAKQFLGDLPNVTLRTYKIPRGDFWYPFRDAVTNFLDYVRYFQPRYYANSKYRERFRVRARPPWFLQWIFPGPLLRIGPFRTLLMACLRALERSAPVSPEILRFLREASPDLLLVTPLIFQGSRQREILRAGRILGLRTAWAVGTWDHLTTKGLALDVPDRIFVWNEIQREELRDHHGISGERVVVTGAQLYDHWFSRQPSRSREEFCRTIGLNPDRPFVHYVCTTPYEGTPSERGLVDRWIAQLRASPDPRLRGVGILVRPHPSQMEPWKSFEAGQHENVVLWGSNPVDEGSRADLFDSLYHSSAVVGLATGLFLEAGIVGRPVHVILLPEQWENMDGELHFRYLLEVGGGLLHAARDFPEHLDQLAASIEGRNREKSEPFTRAFIRPHGLDRPASPILAEEIARMAQTPAPPPWRPSLGLRALRVLASPSAWIAWKIARRRDSRAKKAGARPPGEVPLKHEPLAR